jgi:glycosyl hydrolase family 26
MPVRPSAPTLAVAFVGALVALLAASSPTNAACAGKRSKSGCSRERAQGPLVPRSGALFGALTQEDDKTWWTRRGVEHFEGSIGRRLDIDHRFYDMARPFPAEDEEWDREHGRTALISWAPGYWDGRSGYSLDDILRGDLDQYVRDRARRFASFGAPIFFRPMAEMNGDWSAWNGRPDVYVAAWRRIHDLFEEEGAHNVVWVWCPNAVDWPSAPWNRAALYYPGNAYVDWVGIDGYNWGQSSWVSFTGIFETAYREWAGRKPIMIAETGASAGGGSRAAWLLAARDALKSRFAAVAAVVWFDVAVPGHRDWRLRPRFEGFSAFRSLAADRYFNVRAASLPPPLRRDRFRFATSGRSLWWPRATSLRRY